MKTELTIEESARLIELGVDAKLASKCWISSPSNREEKVLANHDPFYYELLVNPEPVFTLADILSILPKDIEIEKTSSMNLVFYWNKKNRKWGACYDNSSKIKTAPELIDALNSLLIWCLTEKKINLNTDKK